MRTLIAAVRRQLRGKQEMRLSISITGLSRLQMENEMRFLAIGLCALAMLPAVSQAQQLSQPAAKGPTVQAAAVGFRTTEAKVNATTKSTAAPIVSRHQGQDVALMAVGVGAMIAGALIGDTAGTIIVIGGAGMALFGLYHYLE
ncbi:MAG: hypothetical protein ACRD3J_18725 [Thermoanaerobaculia bacterium]